ncbi:MAG: Gfo/Idh/MocA family oxidoreductase [Candidatus Thioglobus sp.]|uniref:Gfo/Idh/MocA family protein n=1 Tax=Candidatus Thioglobus sp. TaxID=2026721 RepID=UPI0026351CFD|nr:Gfo/Idh/MocA family oxidoreductase [Candidatus Thioglobus sp.]MDC9727369.1 Gfo/Idh/MocA family oxidoreductase [Candidatus Thioglobus sp.]
MLNFALVGCGRIAKRHSELLGFNEINGAKLVSVCDNVIDKANKIAEQFKVSSYQEMDEMMKSESIDVVVILTPSGLHAEHVINLSKYGKHIMVEKPMALTIKDTENMIYACDANDVKLFVIKQNRFNVPVVKLREALDAGRFGKLTLGTVRVRWARHQAYYDQDPWRGTWAMDGGVLTNQASHHVDMLEWMMGDVESVFAKMTTALADVETEDTAIVALKFKNGALGIIEATTATRPTNLEGSISILGAHGTVVVGGVAVNEMQTWVFEDEQEGDSSVLEEFSVNPPNVYGFGHQAYYEHVVDCIVNGSANLVDGLQGRKSIELISAIYESAETGKEVFLKFQPKHRRLGQKS